MAMGLRGKAEVNVTPLIDVLLVLLIIFMLIGGVSSGLEAWIPQPARDQVNPPRRDLMITVLNAGTVRVDQMELEVSALSEHLRSLASQATTGVVFIHANDELEFDQVARVIDIAKGAGWSNIALMPKPAGE